MKTFILTTLLLLISLVANSANFDRDYRFDKNLKGEYVLLDSRPYCTHANTKFGFSYKFRGDTSVIIGLYVLNKETTEISTYKLKEWQKEGTLARTRIFKKSSRTKDFPKFIAIRQSHDDTDDITFLNSYRNADNFEIESVDSDFGYTFYSSASAKVSTCTKK